MEIVIYLCRLFTAVDGCGWMRRWAKCNLHKMKFRNSVTLRKLFGNWNSCRHLAPPPRSLSLSFFQPPCPVQRTFHVQCDAVDGNLHCVRSMWNAMRYLYTYEYIYIYYLLNRMKTESKTKQNIVSNVEAKNFMYMYRMYVCGIRMHRYCMQSWFAYRKCPNGHHVVVDTVINNKILCTLYIQLKSVTRTVANKMMKANIQCFHTNSINECAGNERRHRQISTYVNFIHIFSYLSLSLRNSMEFV